MPDTDPAEAARQLRRQALAITPAKLGVAPSAEFPRVYGVLMEWPIGEATATVTSFVTGDASLYTSAGFGVIGGFAHERVRAAAKRFVKVAERDYGAAIPTHEFPLPSSGKVRFVLLGYSGRRSIEDDVPSPSGSGGIFDLFSAGQNVLTELRLVAQAKGH